MLISNEKLNAKFIDLWEKGKTEYFDEIFSSHFEHHYDGMTSKGKETYKNFFSTFFNDFEDLKFFIEEHYYSPKDAITYRWHAKGSRKGDCQERQADQKTVEFSGLTLIKIKDGKIISVWTYNDLPPISCRCSKRN